VEGLVMAGRFDPWRTVFRVRHPDCTTDQYATREEAVRAAREGDLIMKVLDMNGGRFAFVGWVSNG